MGSQEMFMFILIMIRRPRAKHRVFYLLVCSQSDWTFSGPPFFKTKTVYRQSTSCHLLDHDHARNLFVFMSKRKENGVVGQRGKSMSGVEIMIEVGLYF